MGGGECGKSVNRLCYENRMGHDSEKAEEGLATGKILVSGVQGKNKRFIDVLLRDRVGEEYEAKEKLWNDIFN